MPGTVAAQADYTACAALNTADTCAPVCPDGFSPSGFSLVCEAGVFNASLGACVVNRCSAGPVAGTTDPNANYSSCVGGYTGQDCKVECRKGYTLQGTLPLVCSASGRFDTSGATCDANKCINGPFWGRAEHANYTDCNALRSGETCTPQCHQGYTVTASFELVCYTFLAGQATAFMYDASAARCIPNNCTSGPSAYVDHEVVYDACSALSTGAVCDAALVHCKDKEYIPVGGFTMSCSAGRQYSAQGLRCIFADPCDRGPIPGTADARADYTLCDSVYTGERCAPVCPEGYTLSHTANGSEAAAFEIVCDNGMYNASSVRCLPNVCSDGPLFGRDRHANYTMCNRRVSGEVCIPECEKGYTAINTTTGNATAGFELSCIAFSTGDGSGRKYYLYDADGITCDPNRCWGGPTYEGSTDGGADYTNCSAKKTGQVCRHTDLGCWKGYVSRGVQSLVCTGGLTNGTYHAGALWCEEVLCNETQYVLSHQCVDCPPAMASKAGTSAADADTTCHERRQLWRTDWKPGLHEVVARSACDVLNLPGGEGLPWQLHPFQVTVGSSPMRHHSGALVCGMSVVGALLAAGALVPCRHPLRGAQYLVFNMLLPGMSFSAMRIIAHYGVSTGADHALAAVSGVVNVAELVSLWVLVLRRGAFQARYTPVETESRAWGWMVGRNVWEPADIGGTFRRRLGLSFRWYNGRARWFMACEMVFSTVIGSIVGRWQRTVSECSRRNWMLAASAAGWAAFVTWQRPMRSRVGNVVTVCIAWGLFVGLLMMSTGFELSSDSLYLAANWVLVAAAALQYVRYAVDGVILSVESWHDREARLAGEMEELAHESLFGKRNDKLVAALHRLHSCAGDLRPQLFGSGRDDGGGGTSGGIADRLSGGLVKSGGQSWTTEELRSHLCNWSSFEVKVKEQGSGATRGLTQGVRLSPLLLWLQRFPSEWSSAFPSDRLGFYAQDVVCSGGHVPRQQSGKKTTVCCMSFNLRAVLRRLLPTVIRGDAAWVAQLRTLQPAWYAATDGIAAVLVYTYETLRPKSNGKSRELQIYSEMNRSMREYSDPAARASLSAGQLDRHRKVLQLTCPLILRLEDFLAQMRGPSGMVFRGISIRVAEQYTTGTHFLWGSFSSTSARSTVARDFMRGAGSLFIVAHRRAVDVSWASVFPVEAELVLPSNAIFTVMSKLPDNLLTLLDTNSDVMVVMENLEGLALSAREAVDLALLAVLESSFIYEEFCSRYVEPQLAQAGRDSRRLYAHFDSFMESDKQMLLLTGDGGTGKTSTSLALTARLVQLARTGVGPQQPASPVASPASPAAVASPRRTFTDGAQGMDGLLNTGDSPLPIFVHLPWAVGLLDPGRSDALTHHIQQQMYLDQDGGGGSTEQLQEMQRRPLVVFLDSLDELKGDIGILRTEPLLSRGGIRLAEWPRTKFIVTCRGEFIRQHRIDLACITPETAAATEVQMLPFNNQDVRLYVRQVVRLEVQRIARALRGSPEGDVSKLATMKTIRLPQENGLALQRCLQGRTDTVVPREVAQAVGWQRAIGGVVVRKGTLPGVPEGRVVVKIDGGDVRNSSEVKHALAAGRGGSVTLSCVAPHASVDAAIAAAMKDDAPGRTCVDLLCRATNSVLRVFHQSADGVLGVPFVLYMVVSAAPRLENRPPELVALEPRCQVYEVWIRGNVQERLPRVPVLERAVRDGSLREETVINAAMRVACGMFAAGEWHSTVGRCLSRCDHPSSDAEFQRALLGCMPLRVEALSRDSAALAWRHRTLQEFLIARAIALDPWCQVLRSRSLEHAPEVVNFFRERAASLRKLHPGRSDEVSESLSVAARGPDAVRAANAAALLAAGAEPKAEPLQRPLPSRDETIPSSRRLCVGVTGSCLLTVRLVDTAGAAVRDVAPPDVGGWPTLSGDADSGEGDPFHDQAAYVDLPTAPAWVGQVIFRVRRGGSGGGGGLKLLITDVKRDAPLLRAALPASGPDATDVCALQAVAKGWRLALLQRPLSEPGPGAAASGQPGRRAAQNPSALPPQPAYQPQPSRVYNVDEMCAAAELLQPLLSGPRGPPSLPSPASPNPLASAPHARHRRSTDAANSAGRRQRSPNQSVLLAYGPSAPERPIAPTVDADGLICI
eukprot:TRINITY_DN6328_c3_g1_i1.p1 TRINITY_DN6328_c3_g1~~TRINITY_DN6328_c3_g1_i1.p1  ORF type:complete len:2382 (+),score=741.34 TRINITY_DN6328_c3_g1_i1:791-7147(+)